jgi:hypothetical protein
MYESFYLRAVSPEEPVAVWIRYTIHKRPGALPVGSVWCTVFDARRGRPFMHKLTDQRPGVPAGSWIALGEEAEMGSELARGRCGRASWSLRFVGQAPELRHLSPGMLYRLPLPRTKLTSPAPAARFDGVLELEGGDAIALDGWPGMVGHNWGSEHAERWIWLHGIDFAQAPGAWIDVALGRVRLAGRQTPWVVNGALSFEGRRVRLGGLGARGLRVRESPRGCRLRLPGPRGILVEADVQIPEDSAAGWRYADPDGGEHDVVHCSVASAQLRVVSRDGAQTASMRTDHGGAYELGMRERDHGVPVAPFADG